MVCSVTGYTADCSPHYLLLSHCTSFKVPHLGDLSHGSGDSSFWSLVPWLREGLLLLLSSHGPPSVGSRFSPFIKTPAAWE
jgi:hypothetical protein